MDNFAQVLREGKSKAGLNDEAHPASLLKGLKSAYTSQLESFATGRDPRRIYAVVVGIDNYSSYPLRGCVTDALAMEKCLVEVIGVPKERIQTLLGPRNQHDANVSSIPSRAKILSALRSLLTKADIKHGDPIVVFFAGHGSRYAWSDLDDDKNFGSDNEHSPARAGFVEALCPLDRDNVPDISDRELNTVFSQIYRTGGHPITVILDCCHGGGATRSPRVRTIPPDSLRAMLHTGEEGLIDLLCHQSILAKNWCPDIDSHVVVAACGESELVQEVQTVVREGAGCRGAFTSALINTLRSGALGEGATYENLIKALPHLPSQTPVAEGKRKNMCLWYQI
ncbi:hypothetical protein ARMGADRAFT_1091878 [Armillaria gallica]|uniref:Peptidase C14 caspase domain-containing protein n=1 Tax=Armillaria gallica TaxID=47427 RepID=A0A2H3D014_ARMGA|nr:hypothetical protein ARMGADRAFT_1091878 [Armillaria gallica]